MIGLAQSWAGQLPDSDALWVRLDDDADATHVEDAVINTVQHLLQPNMDVVNDLQVRAVWTFVPRITYGRRCRARDTQYC